MICVTTDCTACGACVQKCVNGCITLCEDEFGFLYPVVDDVKCIECGICEKVCHLNVYSVNETTTVAKACVHRSSDIVGKSTSGGVFSAIAENIIFRNGVVYGCANITSGEVCHVRVDSIDGISMLRGSKYVQSVIGDTYKQVLKDLSDGKWVLYTGTPCQISGLKAFLGREYEQLVTADIICHGVPSSAYFCKFIDWYEEKHGCKVIEVDFRSKKNKGWSYAGFFKIEKDGKIKTRKTFYFENYYYYYFLHSEIFRESCYKCKYTTLQRAGDFTLGDCWGVEGLKLSIDVNNGCSLVLLNTEKAKKLFSELKVCSEDVDIDWAVSNNTQLSKPSTHTILREKLLLEFKCCDGKTIQRHFVERFKLQRIKAMIKYSMPKAVRRVLIKFRCLCK